MTSNFIVTGGAGFIGSNIVAELNARGHKDILIVDRLDCEIKKRNLDDLNFSNYMDKDDFRKKIIFNKQKKVKTVFHMGACSSTTELNEEYLYDNNFLYTKDLCEWCMGNDIRFIYASSAATYGDGSMGYSDNHDITPELKPLNLYGKSKQMFDLWALENKIMEKIVGLKYFNVYGPREDHKGDMRSLVNKAYKQVINTGTIQLFKSYKSEYRDGEQERDFVYIKDAVNVTLFFNDNHNISGIFNCGTGRTQTWLDMAYAVFSAMNKKPNIIFIEMPDSIKDKYQYHTQADISKLLCAGYNKPFMTLETGIQDYISNYMNCQNIVSVR